MWILLFLVTCWSIIAFNTNHQRQSLLIIIFLATGGFQLLPIHWFWSPFLLVKPYDYAYVATGAIFVLRVGELARLIAKERPAALATVYLGFLLLTLVVSVVFFSYSPVKSVQAARVFFWPIFLLLFLLANRSVLERVVNTLYPIVVILSLLYLIQPITGTTIINPSGEYFNPYIGATDVKRYLSTPDFLIFFLLLAYYKLCTYKGKSLGVRLGQALAFVLFTAVQAVSFTRSAIIGTGVAVLYLSKRLVNPVLLVLFLATVSVGFAVAYSTSSLIESRVNDSMKDIASTLRGDYDDFRAGKDGNLSFRIAHISERLTYVTHSVKHWPMGIGFIHEDSAVAQNLGFKIGLKNFLTGRAVQVDTGDNAWSVVIIKTGLIGLGLLLVFLIYSFVAVGGGRDKYAVVYRGGVVYFLVTSFFSSNFVSPSYMVPLMLFLAIALRTQVDLAAGKAAQKGKWQT